MTGAAKDLSDELQSAATDAAHDAADRVDESPATDSKKAAAAG